ncbi:MAG: hypothetical protein RL264_2055 [Bacteroidota bacterium]|jgi:NADH:ubiquinone oxidoreductase subunit 5 (subunit L)/multisubunit Na+/H+ antiporter MnhA subunit
MENVLKIFIILPIIAFLISLILPKKNETLIARNTQFAVIGHFLLSIGFTVYWAFHGAEVINLKEFSIYKSTDYDFFIDFYFDYITLTFLILGSFITSIITIFSSNYLHREEGYKRFFSTLLVFYVGYNIIIFSGNIETLFVGWEVLGISSFLLISFYRDRYIPVKNALKVFSIYRIGDVGIILVMWLSHHLWNENISFFKLNNAHLVHEHINSNSLVGLGIAMMIFISAAAKSAQLPFSSWLPRAMEGPTPSSAVFYGSLSVHIGAFLLLRTEPFWKFQIGFRVFLFLIGLLTSIYATLVGRVQSSIKSQIAYASMSQIGIIFMEIALGWNTFALVHIVGNACLRSYQLLISPSVVSYRIREQFYEFVPRLKTIEDTWPKRVEYTIYILSLKEWNLDFAHYFFLWKPLKSMGQNWKMMRFKFIFVLVGLSLIFGITTLFFGSHIHPLFKSAFPAFFAMVGFMIVIKAFTERDSVRKSWSLIMLNHISIAIAISFSEHFSWLHHVWYLSGIIVSWSIGLITINRLRKTEWVSLNQFSGLGQKHPKTAIVFFLCSLGLSGFPITPSFIGEDLIFSHIEYDQVGLAFFTSLSLIVNGLASIRIYSRIFLGPNSKLIRGAARRSA